jgi:hypothetical protein
MPKSRGSTTHSCPAAAALCPSPEDEEVTLRDVVNDDLLSRRALMLDAIHRNKWEQIPIRIADMAKELQCNQNLISQTVRRYPRYFVCEKPNSTETRKHRRFMLHPHLQQG